MKTLAGSSVVYSAKFLPSFSAIVLGLTVILGLGFMQDANNYIHNAAHDGRHSAALTAGILSGLLLGVLQYYLTQPLILAAEQFEAPATGSEHEWQPEDGWQRFVVMSAFSNALFWLSLGALAGFTLTKLKL
ncbi:CbtB domain-containing protein [Methylotuvimicrobium sp.]|uniref:CbtB domain-containing protein n=1 Tax=Methylotuvimicrobium sp. TaxID=2822413 RepID=UPI003D651ED0